MQLTNHSAFVNSALFSHVTRSLRLGVILVQWFIKQKTYASSVISIFCAIKTTATASTFKFTFHQKEEGMLPACLSSRQESKAHS